jgi:hypothetical protein
MIATKGFAPFLLLDPVVSFGLVLQSNGELLLESLAFFRPNKDREREKERVKNIYTPFEDLPPSP